MGLKDKLLELGLNEDQVTEAMKELDGEYVPKGRFNDLNTELKQTKDQLKEANTKLEGFDPEWKDKVAAAEQKATAELEKLKLSSAIDEALKSSKAKDPEVVRALLKTEDLKLTSDGNVVGLSEQLEAIKTKSDYLFEIEDPQTPKIVTSTPGSSPPIDTKSREAANAAIRAVFGKKE